MESCKIAYITTVDQSILYLLLNQIKELQESGYEVVSISAPGSRVPAIERARIRHISVPMTRRITPVADLWSLVRLIRVLRQERCTIVHTHTPKAGLLGQMAARLAGVPIVVHSLHGFYLHDRMSTISRRLYLQLERFGALFSDTILSVNCEDVGTALDARVCDAGKIKHVGGGIDIREFDRNKIPALEVQKLREQMGLPVDTPVVGFVGRLAGRRKGFIDFLAAAKIIRSKCPRVRFLVIGGADSGKPDAVEPSAAADFGVADCCIFAGERSVNELARWYSLMTVVALPSLFEGLPRVLMEAASMSIPAVATDVKGNREVVLHERNGLLVPLGDVAGLADAILRILNDVPLAKRMAEAGRAMAVERFDEQVIFSRIKSEYSRLLATISGVKAAQRLRGS